MYKIDIKILKIVVVDLLIDLNNLENYYLDFNMEETSIMDLNYNESDNYNPI